MNQNKNSLTPAKFKQVIDRELCRRCKRCILGCGFEALTFENGILGVTGKCVACHYCVTMCPEGAITIQKQPLDYRDNEYWTVEIREELYRQSETGGVILASMGNDKPFKSYFDHLVLDACQVTNPSIDPLREPMELRTYLGRKPEKIEVEKDESGAFRLKEKLPVNLMLETPIIFGGMSYGSISLNAHKALAMAAKNCGILMNTGEGGLHKDLYPYADNIIVQCASGRFGVNEEYLRRAAMIEIKIGQGAKPGIGGHLPGEKVTAPISETRMIPIGTDALSPAPHHDIYSIEDLRQLIFSLKEATEYKKPVCVKISAVHNVAAIASGIARAGADVIYVDGFRGGTGATPKMVRDHVGIPIELAIAAVDDRLRQENIRHQVSLIAAGGIRTSADMIKAIGLGADAVAICTAALVALGCHICQQCHTGNCSWGIATQRPELERRLDPEWGAQQLTRLVQAWSYELKEVLGLLGVNAVESFRGSRERLRGIGLSELELDILGIKHAGR
jgi:glutamate synthase domain-containing protein 2